MSDSAYQRLSDDGSDARGGPQDEANGRNGHHRVLPPSSSSAHAPPFIRTSTLTSTATAASTPSTASSSSSSSSAFFSTPPLSRRNLGRPLDLLRSAFFSSLAPDASSPVSPQDAASSAAVNGSPSSLSSIFASVPSYLSSASVPQHLSRPSSQTSLVSPRAPSPARPWRKRLLLRDLSLKRLTGAGSSSKRDRLLAKAEEGAAEADDDVQQQHGAFAPDEHKSGREERDGSSSEAQPAGHTPLLSRLLAFREDYISDHGSRAVTDRVHGDFASSSLSSTFSSSATDSAQLSSDEALSGTLVFRSSAIESAYKRNYFTKYFSTLRLAVLACCVIWCLFFITDLVKHRRSQGRTLGLRFSVAGVVLLPTLLSFHRSVRRLIDTDVLRCALFVFILLFGTCQVAFGVMEDNTLDPTYCTFIILISSMSASLFRLPFFLSTSCNLLLLVIFLGLTLESGAYQATAQSAALPTLVAAVVWICIGLVLFSFHGYTVEHSMRSTFLAAHKLSVEEEKSQRVLATMLPTRVINELRTAPTFVYEHHHSISVLFSHIHDFDAHTAKLPPKYVVELLNNLFSRFDHLTDIFGVYKVETIGDVYLLSGGVPEALEQHASILALLSLAMMEEMKMLAKSLKPEHQKLKLQLRIGIHSGSVIAGVVGMKYPRYRLMGDTVNTASRMSTTCEATQIQLSADTFSQLHSKFVCRYNGRRFVKGKGDMETYLLRFVLPGDSEALLPVGTDEAVGSKTAEEVGVELLGSLASTLPSVPKVTQLPRRSSQPLSVSALQKALSNSPDRRNTLPPSNCVPPHTPFTPTAANSTTPPASRPPLGLRQNSAPSEPLHHDVYMDEAVAVYHAHPAVGCLYSNATIPPSAIGFRYDDRDAVLELQARGRPVHLWRRLRGQLELDEDRRLQGERYVAHIGSEPTRVRDELRQLSSGGSLLADVKEEQPAAELAAAAVNGELRQADDSQPNRAQSAPSTCSTSPSSSPASVPASGSGAKLVLPSTAELSPSLSASEASSSQPSGVFKISAKEVRVNFLADVPHWSELQQANYFDLSFLSHPHLEMEFQHEWRKKSRQITRMGLGTFFLSQFGLGLHDALVFWPQSSDGVALVATVLRSLAVLVGATVFVSSYRSSRLFWWWQQPIVALSWTLMSQLQIMISVLFLVNDAIYGFSTTLILITTTSFFAGLQFKWVCFTTVSILLFYFLSGLMHDGRLVGNAFFLLASVVLSILSARSSEYFQRLDFIRYLTLNSEERKTREILDNMLPTHIMQDIIRQQQQQQGVGEIIAHEVNTASVLFCDIVEFTQLAARSRPQDVVAYLNIMFSTFDALTTKHRVYKVETIGDAYLACSGVVSKHACHTVDLVRCALDFQAASRYFHTTDNQPLQVRIGIHTGNVVAGVVGIWKMPRYHLFGETVTVAEEMEQSGLPRGVVVSGETYKHISDQFECRPLDEPLRSNKMSRWQVLQYKGEYTAQTAAPTGEEEALPLPKVAEILLKVHEANLRQMELRSRRRGGVGAGLPVSASSGSSSLLQVRVDSVGGAAEPDIASASQPSQRPLPDGRRRSHSDTSIPPTPRSGGGSNSSSKAASPVQPGRTSNGTHSLLQADESSPSTFLRLPLRLSSPVIGFTQPVFTNAALAVDRRSPVAV